MTTINGRACVANRKNLFSQSTATAGYVGGGGTVYPAHNTTNEIVSDYISVSASSNYTFQMWGTTPSGQAWWYGIGLYDSNKNFISRTAPSGNKQTSDTVEYVSTTLTTTSTTAYVRVSFRKYNDFKAKLEDGTLATPLTPAPVDKVFSDGKQVYGRNLLTGTAKFTFPFNNNRGTQTVQKYDDETNYNQYTSNTPIYLMGFWFGLTPDVGQVYTLSADVCGNGYIEGNTFRWEGGGNGSLGQVDLTDNWQRISNTISANTASGNWIIYSLDTSLLKIKNIKIEKGSVATPWTPAPEDVLN